MAKKKVEKKMIQPKNWVSNFTIIGEAKISDFTFKLEQQSKRSSFVYNRMSLAIDSGERYGINYVNLMGGYDGGVDNYKISSYGKDKDNKTDFSKKMEIDWNNRLDKDIVESVGDFSLITVALENKDDGKLYYRKFLSPYDAIEHIQQNLENGMVIRVTGKLTYKFYQDNVQISKDIKRIELYKATPDKYKATFTQSVLIDKYSAKLKKEFIDKDKSTLLINTRVIDYNSEVKAKFPYEVEFEYKMDFSDEKKCKKTFDKLFKVKKDITQINFEGEMLSGGNLVQATWEDIPDEIKELVECGIYTKEEALQACSTTGGHYERMVLTRPMIRKTGEGVFDFESLIFPELYTEEELEIDMPEEDSNDGFMNIPDAIEEEELPFDLGSGDDDNDDNEEDKTEKVEGEVESSDDEDDSENSWLEDL